MFPNAIDTVEREIEKLAVLTSHSGENPQVPQDITSVSESIRSTL
jgi:hypothetical protein